MGSASSESAAEQLREWFDSVVRLTDQTLFSVVAEGPHRDAVVLDILTRKARDLAQSEVDRDRKLYTPLCLFLVAACRRLGTSLGEGHWRSAVKSVSLLAEQMARTRAETATIGLELGSPASHFKLQLDEAIIQAGLAGNPSYLDKGNRQIALALAINWGIRFLLAYAMECGEGASEPKRKDLAWIANLLATPSNAA